MPDPTTGEAQFSDLHPWLRRLEQPQRARECERCHTTPFVYDAHRQSKERYDRLCDPSVYDGKPPKGLRGAVSDLELGVQRRQECLVRHGLPLALAFHTATHLRGRDETSGQEYRAERGEGGVVITSHPDGFLVEQVPEGLEWYPCSRGEK